MLLKNSAHGLCSNLDCQHSRYVSVLSWNSEDLERMPMWIIFVYIIFGAKAKINKGFLYILSANVLNRDLQRSSVVCLLWMFRYKNSVIFGGVWERGRIVEFIYDYL